jgi:hypothetical protein
MDNPFGLRDGWMPLGLATLLAATAFTVAVLMCVAMVVEGFPDTACDGKGEGRGTLVYQRSETFPPETTCGFRDPDTHQVSEVSLIPWEPMRWLLPALAISIPVILLLGLIASILNIRREGGRGEVA